MRALIFKIKKTISFDRFAMISVLFFFLFHTPIYLIPSSMLIQNPQTDFRLTNLFYERFVSNDIKEITMTNYVNPWNGHCYSKQSFLKKDKITLEDRIYKYWVDYCFYSTGSILDFKITRVDDGLKMFFYPTKKPLYKRGFSLFHLENAISKPMAYFSKY